MRLSKTIEDIVAFYVAFERVRHFQDGTGRVGRLILFKECLKHNIENGVPVFSVLVKQRFEDIYYSYHKQMLVIAKGILRNQQDAEDAVQNALLNIARHMDRVPKGNQKILTAYIYTTARNTAISLLRKKSREVETVNMDALPLAVIDEIPDFFLLDH